MTEYDAIIIGSGLGGLGSAAVLAKEKKNVLVLEKNHYFGGYAVVFQRKGFKFDLSCHSINSFKGVTPDILDRCGIKGKINLIKPKFAYHSFFPGYDFTCMQSGPDMFKRILFSSFPKERRNISKLISLMSNIYYGFKNSSGPDSGYISRDLIKFANLTCSQVINRFLKDRTLRSIFGQLYFFFGSSLKKTSFLNFCNIFFDYLCKGSYLIEGGSNKLVDELVAVIRKNGGRLVLDSEVTKIIIGKNNVSGVVTKDGKEYLCKDVISDISPDIVFRKLIDRRHLGDGLDALDSLEPSISAFAVFVGTKCDYKSLLPFEFLMFLNTGSSLDRQFQAALKCDFKNTTLAVTLFSNIDSSYAPLGKSSLSIISLSGYNFWKGLKNDEYLSVKEKCADILVNRANDILPGLTDSIEIRNIATPLTMERYTGNYRGAIYGAARHTRRLNIASLLRESKINNLYFAGAWSSRGGGYLGSLQSGVIAAESALDRGMQ
ncbi:MAG: NAD(P)/FAD-dependent oxidoreductase [Candidatus Omnitrophota bacterium]|jgi:prolycopene isomerase|nr:MAG: NAD(P)/FAD-dependent oxidoreductase [Candidatus Omnitrophota bacterium]